MALKDLERYVCLPWPCLLSFTKQLQGYVRNRADSQDGGRIRHRLSITGARIEGHKLEIQEILDTLNPPSSDENRDAYECAPHSAPVSPRYHRHDLFT
jgi:hypothetical protein